jgi:hypothetical protein
MDVGQSKTRATVAIILSTELAGKCRMNRLFRPEDVCTVPEETHFPVVAEALRITWQAENCFGERVYCIGMTMEEFCAQYQKKNYVIAADPRLGKFGKKAWTIRRKFRVLPGGRKHIKSRNR